MNAETTELATEVANEESTALIVGETVGLLSGRQAAVEALPAFMREDTTGMDGLGKIITPPRLKIIQGSASPELKAEFNEGDLIISPQNILVSPVKLNDNQKPTGEGEPFAFVPVCWFIDYLVENPIDYKGTEPYIRDRSTDPNSDIGRRARNPDTWTAPHPERPVDAQGKHQFIRFVECYNFVVFPLGIDELAGMPIVLSFSKTTHKVGSNLASLLSMRGGGPIYGHVFQLHSKAENNAKGDYYGLVVSNPRMEDVGVGPNIQDEAEYKFLAKQCEELSGRVEVNYDDEAPVSTSYDANATVVESVPDDEIAF